jgi:hypothetical protein
MEDENISEINKLLKSAGFTYEINNLKDLKEFLSDPQNRKLDIYNDVEELYDILMLGAGLW